MPTQWVFVDFTSSAIITKQPKSLRIRVANEIKIDSTTPEWQEGTETIKIEEGMNVTEVIKGIIGKYSSDKNVLALHIMGNAVGLSQEYLRCSSCGQLQKVARTRDEFRRDGLICPNCQRTKVPCPRCGTWVLSKDIKIDSYGEANCLECQKLWEICPNCGSWRDKRPEKICPNCTTKRKSRVSDEERRRIRDAYRAGIVADIHDYSHKPSPIFYKLDSDEEKPLYFGVELEVDGFMESKSGDSTKGKQATRMLASLFDNEKLFYLKYDCSLDTGFEIVTHPCTLGYHSTKFPWKDIKKIVIAQGGRSHETETCGLHVHFNSNYFGSPQTQEWDLNVLKLLNITNHFWRQIVKFSRRKPGDLQAYASRFYEDFKITPGNSKKLRDLTAGQVRHRAINLTRPQQTIEVRIFKGTLNDRTIIATLQFLDYIIHWVKKATVQDIDELTWEKLIGGIDQEKNPELIEYLVKRNLLEGSK